MKKCADIDQFSINRYADMPLNDEGGLHLGLRYENGYADEHHLFINPGEYKKICFAIRDMETEREAEWIAWARSYIGEDLFDTLLDPSMPAATEYFTEIIKSV